MPTVVLQPGSTIFVTGVNGLVGSHVADQLLTKGYHVRGAVRDVEKSRWLVEYFAGKNQEGKFELVSVPDMTVDGCYDELVKEADGFVHIASPLNGEDPNVVIPIAVNSALNALKAARKTPSVKRFVYTSSSMAATIPKPNVEFDITDQSWNEESIERGWKISEEKTEHSKWLHIYGALKTEAEKACWRWIKENKPDFVFNSILPNANFGNVLVPEKQGTPSTIAWIKCAFTGEQFDAIKKVIQPQWFVSTQDCALIHIGALIYSDIDNERLLAFAEPFNWNRVLAVLRELYPARKFPDGVEGEPEDKSKVANGRAEEVLKWIKGSGWAGLEESLKETCEQFI